MQALRAAICLCFITLAYSEQYVPGKSGGEWSEEDIRITRNRVWEMLEKKKGTITNQPVSEVGLLRLAFHDCLTYKDGTGGCDGEWIFYALQIHCVVLMVTKFAFRMSKLEGDGC